MTLFVEFLWPIVLLLIVAFIKRASPPSVRGPCYYQPLELPNGDFLSFMRSFGHDGPYDFAEVGINGKNSEFNAAMGLCNLKHIDEIIAKQAAKAKIGCPSLRELWAIKIDIDVTMPPLKTSERIPERPTSNDNLPYSLKP